MRLIGLFAAGVVLALATPAHAQKAEAAAAFERGKALLAEGKVAEACPEFELSMRLDPQSGTLYNLARCHEQLGKVASAWVEFKELAETDNNAARAKDSAKRAATLEKKVTRMRIVAAASPPGLVVKRDDVDVTPLIGKETPVDPATYTFVESAPGFKDATLQADLTAPGQTIEVTLPALEPATDTAKPEPKVAIATDPYASRLTLRPVALPRGVYVLGAHADWYSSEGFEQDPIDTVVAFRGGFGRIEARAMVDVHTRYSALTSTRPTLVRVIGAGADYLISPLFTAGIDIETRHPLGDDIDKGFDFRSDITVKRIVTPAVAFLGSGGIGYQSRQNRGQDNAHTDFGLVGDGVLQLSPLDRISLEAQLQLRVSLNGDLYGDTLLAAIGAGATAVLTRNLDAYIQALIAVLPTGEDLSIYTLGVSYRLP